MSFDVSSFNPEAFLSAVLTEPTEKRIPLPIGDYIAQIGEVKPRTWTGKADPTKSGVAMDIPLFVDVPPEIAQQINSTGNVATLRDSLMLDLTDAGTLDNSPGRNRRLRNYREALDMNKPGDAFSFKAMEGKLIRIKISHELYDGAPVERIESVTKV